VLLIKKYIKRGGRRFALAFGQSIRDTHAEVRVGKQIPNLCK
jgi:hypothetical protein